MRSLDSAGNDVVMSEKELRWRVAAAVRERRNRLLCQ
jgi:hypothetical protein